MKLGKISKKFLCGKCAGGITAYAMILLGMTVMLFLFGFTTMWETYTGEESGAILSGEVVSGDEITQNELTVTDPALNIGYRIFDLLTNSISATLLSTVTVGAGLVFLFLFRKNTAVWQYIIPIILLVVLNIFVFPISAMSGDMSVYDAIFVASIGFGFTTFLIVFFNLFYILAVLEFVRGGGST